MQWRFMVAMLGLMLSACLHSDPAYIAPNDLVIPSGLEGRYWAIGHNDERNDADFVTFTKGSDGLLRARGLADSTDKETSLRFVRIAEPDLYLLVDDSEKDASAYYLFRKRANGVWDMYEPSLEKAFAEGQAVYLDTVARRHGLSLDIGGDGSAIEGPVEKGTIPALFRDPDFMAALDTELLASYLPLDARADLDASPAIEAADDATQSMMVFTGTFTDWHGIVQPLGLSDARYLDLYDGAGLADGVTSFRRRSDGRFDLVAPGLETLPVAFLPLDKDKWLAIEEHTSTYEGKQDTRYLFDIMTRVPKGWTWQSLWLGDRYAIPEIARERVRAMKEAAARQGISFDTTLSGAITPSAFAALMRDGKFTIGVSREEGISRTLYPEPAILERFKVPTASAHQSVGR